MDVLLNEYCADERWEVLERRRAHYERQRREQLDMTTYEPPSLVSAESEIMALAAETIDRWGYDYGRSLVAAVLDNDDTDSVHAALMANNKSRFRDRGLLAFAGWLMVHIAADEIWRGRA